MKPELTPKEANDLMRDAGDDTSLADAAIEKAEAAG